MDGRYAILAVAVKPHGASGGAAVGGIVSDAGGANGIRIPASLDDLGQNGRPIGADVDKAAVAGRVIDDVVRRSTGDVVLGAILGLKHPAGHIVAAEGGQAVRKIVAGPVQAGEVIQFGFGRIKIREDRLDIRLVRSTGRKPFRSRGQAED